MMVQNKKRQFPRIYKKFFKRFVDVFFSFWSLVVLSPIMLVTAILVRIKLGSPVIFKQERPGLDGKMFYLYKFRSMNDKRDEEGNLLPDDVRLTPFGRKLRSLSLDELPELINILKGEMSLIGPRPLLKEYLPYYTQEELRRHSMRPGLTGWAQANGRNVTAWDERLQQDIYYVDNCSFILDCKIVLLTAFKVIRKSDILVGNQHAEGHGRLDVVRKDKAVSEVEIHK